MRFSSEAGVVMPPRNSKSEFSIVCGPFCRTWICSPGEWPTDPTRFCARPPFMSLIGGRAGTAEELRRGARNSLFILIFW